MVAALTVAVSPPLASAWDRLWPSSSVIPSAGTPLTSFALWGGFSFDFLIGFLITSVETVVVASALVEAMSVADREGHPPSRGRHLRTRFGHRGLTYSTHCFFGGGGVEGVLGLCTDGLPVCPKFPLPSLGAAVVCFPDFLSDIDHHFFVGGGGVAGPRGALAGRAPDEPRL